MSWQPSAVEESGTANDERSLEDSVGINKFSVGTKKFNIL